MNPNFVELSLSLKQSYVPKSLSNLFLDLSKIDNESNKLLVLNDYICKHEEELSRVEASKHELPQCRLLLIEAIETLKKEFMNIKNAMESHPYDHQYHHYQPGDHDHHLVEYLGTERKSNIDQQQVEQREIRGKFTYTTPPDDHYAKKQKTLVLDSNYNNFEPPNLKAINHQAYKEISSTSNSIGSSSSTININHHHLQPRPLTQPIWKNNRRCWSQELHARFVEALILLGGIEVATPKQITDLMQVEGLTIDQVKSHLQKYRLHCGKVLESYVNRFG